MNIPLKYEDVVAKLDAALAREAALREELDNVRDLHSKQCCVFCNDTGNLRAVHADLQQRLTVAEQRASDAIELLEVWRTWLGFNRESCDNGGKRIWDRIDAVVALKPAEVITPEEDHWEK